MTALAAMQAGTQENVLNVFIERETPDGKVYYRWAASDVTIDPAPRGAGVPIIANLQPFAPPYVWAMTAAPFFDSFTEPVITTNIYGEYEGRVMGISPIRRGVPVNQSRAFPFPERQA